MKSPSTYCENLENQLQIAEKRIMELEVLLKTNKIEEDNKHNIDYYYKLLAENSTDIICVLNKDYEFEYISPSVERLTGYTQNEALKFTLIDFLAKDSEQLVMKKRLEVVKNNAGSEGLILQFIRKDKSTFFGEVHSNPIFDKNGEFIGLHANCRNVNEKVLLEKQLQLERERFQILVSKLNDRILVFDKTGIMVFSSYIPIWFDKSHPQFMTDSNFDPIHPDDKEKLVNALHEIFITKKCMRMDYRSKGDGDSYEWVEGIGTVIKLPGSDELFVINVVRDISQRKQLEEDLSNAIKTKDKLFSIIGHDLRSPFNTILGYASLLYENYDIIVDSDRKKYIKDVLSASKTAFKLTDDLLTWASLQKGSIIFKSSTFDIGLLIKKLINTNIKTASFKNVSLLCNCDKNVMATADKTSVKIIMENLLSNAIKFTKNGGTVNITLSTDNDYVHVYVVDTGIGMGKELLGKIFTINEQVTRKGTNNEKGTGLGLLLCNEFAKKNKGKISVTSEVGIGSVFVLSLPKENTTIECS